MKFKNYLKSIDACFEAVEWAGEKTFAESYAQCERGDWLLWLFANTNPEDKRLITLAKGLCAKTVIHLMKDERSVKAVQAAIAYGNGEIGEEELNAAAAAAYAAAAYAAAAAAAYAAADADAAYAAAYAAAVAAARKKNQQETADIVREIIPIEKWNINQN